MGKKKGKSGGDGDKKEEVKSKPKPLKSSTTKDEPGASGDVGKPQPSLSHQPQGAWGSKGSDQPKQPQSQQQPPAALQPEHSQPQGAWAVKGSNEQKYQKQQPQQEQPQQKGASGGKGSDKQKPSQRQQQQQQQQPQHQQPQQQGVWGGKGADQQKYQRQQQQQPPQQQGAWSGKGSDQQKNQRQQQQQPPQQQGAWGGKGSDQQKNQRQQQQQPPQQQGAWGGKGSDQQKNQRQQQQQPQGPQHPETRKHDQPVGKQREQKHPQQTPDKLARAEYVGQQQQLKQSSSISSITSSMSDTTIKSTSSPSTPKSSVSSLSQKSNVSLARGTRGKSMTIETNYLELILDKMKDCAFQYDIKFVPDVPKRFLRSAFMEYCKAVEIPSGGLAFDGKSIVFSPKKLLPRYITTCEVNVLEPESSREKAFKVTLMEAQYSEIELKSLRTYKNDRIFDKPMRALQCLDVILSSPCHQKGTRGGRSFYNPPTDGKRIDLSESYELWLGLFQAAVLGERPFLNIDISHRAFPSAVPIINVIQSLAGPRGHNLNDQLPSWLERALHDYLRGLVVIYCPPKCLNSIEKRFKYQSIKMSSDRQEFTIDTGRKLTVAQYFAEKGYRLEYPILPCIHVGNTIKTNYIPVEFCKIAAGQLNLKKAGPRQVSAMIRHAATSTDIRKQKILQQFNYMAHNENPTLKYFGVSLGREFIKVGARVLDAPSLEYYQKKVEPRNGSWVGASYIKPAECLEWAILILDERTYEDDGRKFGQMIVSAARNLNMNISEKFVLLKIREDRLDDNLRKFKQENKCIVFVIISGRNQNSYSKVKQNAEIRFGVLTQCIKPDTIAKRLNRATIENILLKVNAKLNGFNHRIHPQSSTIIMNNKNVMFIGADVTHPTPDQKTIPSVVGVVASHDLDGFQYNMQWCLQEPTQEIIVHMQEITLNHLNRYEKMNKKLPEVIIYYRDGVSDGQFPDITNIELRAMDAAFSKKNPGYRPKLTCLVVQKRHHTRFFPQAGKGVGKFNNVPPGTCVDQTITHPNECQFFLVSHESIQGTAKPTKYCVLRDDSHFNIDDLQAITFNMCHMFARCNRSVSYPAPAYYAHHSASRGKIYIEGQNLNMRDLQHETRKREIKSEIVGSRPMFFV